MDIKYIGEAKIDSVLKEIRERGQTKNFKIKEGAPLNNEGEVGNIWVIKDSNAYYLYVKVDKNNWRRVLLTEV
ncbi:MAG: hypothetical protein NC918_02715 [Candidatus Omnitrophica bacterium]|nr:hypothetical protein [Candidatus Omnitrophota bacterium]